MKAKRHKTQPRPRYTAASLVRKLEEDGLGRPSTYASILSTIQDRGYVFTLRRALVATFLAYAVTDLLERHFGDLVEPEFSAGMEEALDAIARGEADSVSHLRAFYFGEPDAEQVGEQGGDANGEAGQRLGLSRRIEAAMEKIKFPSIPVGQEPGSEEEIVVRIGRFGPYLQRGKGGVGNTASLPDDLAPADLTAARAMELLNRRAEGPRDLGRDPDSLEPVLLQSGRYGPYVQRGPNPPPKTKKVDMPRRASVPPGMAMDEVTLEDALLWLSLPRDLGADPAGAGSIVAANGRFGPYLQRGGDSKDTRSLEETDDIYTLTLERALELFAQPKSAGFQRSSTSRALRELGAHPDSGRPVRLLDGRFGPYVTDGATNASIPRELDHSRVTLEQALTLIAERALAPKGGRKVAGKRAASRRAAPRTTQARGKKRAAKSRARKSK